ncbi:MAG TPA: YbjQ family protein [Acidimicrobiales bacterium]|nr:YbjQ family protein [Acidimicrobiales bacterium]
MTTQDTSAAASAGTGAGYATFPITTTFEFPEYVVQRTLGSCFGLVVRSMGAVRGIGASFRAVVGGEVGQYTKLLEDSRRHAMDRLIENARIMGANAVVGMRFDSSEIGQALTEIVAYGTAVIIGPRR